MSLQPDDYPRMLDELRATFTSGHTRSPAWRRDQLAAVERMLRDNEKRFNGALQDDLGKPAQEVLLGETALLFSEIRHARRKLKRWMRPRRTFTPLIGQPARSWVQPEPLGVVLIIGGIGRASCRESNSQ